MKRLLTVFLLMALLVAVSGCGMDSFSPEHRTTDHLSDTGDQIESTELEEFSLEDQENFPDAVNIDPTQETQQVDTKKETTILETEAVTESEPDETEAVTTTILPTTKRTQTAASPPATSASESAKAEATTGKATSQTASRVETDKEFPYMCSRNSKVFHKTNCGHGAQIKEENRVYFETREEAVNAGLEPCKHCKP